MKVEPKGSASSWLLPFCLLLLAIETSATFCGIDVASTHDFSALGFASLPSTMVMYNVNSDTGTPVYMVQTSDTTLAYSSIDSRWEFRFGGGTLAAYATNSASIASAELIPADSWMIATATTGSPQPTTAGTISITCHVVPTYCSIKLETSFDFSGVGWNRYATSMTMSRIDSGTQKPFYQSDSPMWFMSYSSAKSRWEIYDLYPVVLAYSTSTAASADLIPSDSWMLGTATGSPPTYTAGTLTITCLVTCKKPTSYPGYVAVTCADGVEASSCAMKCDTVKGYYGNASATCATVGGNFTFSGCNFCDIISAYDSNGYASGDFYLSSTVTIGDAGYPAFANLYGTKSLVVLGGKWSFVDSSSNVVASLSETTTSVNPVLAGSNQQWSAPGVPFTGTIWVALSCSFRCNKPDPMPKEYVPINCPALWIQR